MAQIIFDDMQGDHHEDYVHPHGVPLGYEFAQGPVRRPDKIPLQGNIDNITGWGQIYEEAAGSPATNTRVKIRKHRTYILSQSTGQWWTLVYDEQPSDGTGYWEDFSNDTHVVNYRTEADGYTSVKPGDGYCYHFYQGASLDPSDVAGVVTIFEAKLILEDSNLPDDRDIANFIASGGIDQYAIGHEYAGDIGIGKFKRVTNEWRTFTTSCPPFELADIESNPPE